MFRKCKKPLVYLLATMLVMPTYLVTGMLTATRAEAASIMVTTENASSVTSFDATLQGLNGDSDAAGHSFWVSLAPFDTSSSNIPSHVYSTPDLGPIAAETHFTSSLSSIAAGGVPANLPAVTPGTTYYFAAWSDIDGVWYPGAVRSFTTDLAGTLSAEDFGVVDYNTGATGQLKGYTAGFGLADATFEGATSVVVKLFSGDLLLQTNTANIKKFNQDITGSQISSPFDVLGGFDYTLDGYWTNARASEYGKNLVPTRVVATVTLANGKIVTAGNTNLSGNATTIVPLGTLSAEDFGVVNYNTGATGQIYGYTAGFGLADADFEGATSIIIRLYAAGDQLLQTNTATLKAASITGTQISAPFDVRGSFDYATDGYWSNVREAEYGQAVPAVKVVATVILKSGKVVWATNLNPSGDLTRPTTPIANPGAGNFADSQTVSLTSHDNKTSDENIRIYYTTDGSMPNSSSTLYTLPISVIADTTILAVAYDEAGNASAIATLSYDIAPRISGEAATNPSNTSVTITWTTDQPSTSRVVYDTVSHAIADLSGYPSNGTSNYGYAFSTSPDSGKFTSHSMVVTGLTSGTKYYFRTISSGSPESIGAEASFATLPTAVITVAEATTTAETTPATASVSNPASASSSAAEATPTPSDSQGQIKGDDTNTNTSTDDGDKVNWTPWIILFILIILAGAATGGYFYWFAGEEDAKTGAKEVQKTAAEEKPKTKVAPAKPAAKSSNKKSKRW